MSSIKFQLSSTAAALVFAPLAALAHGPQVQIGINNGKLVTTALFADEPYQGFAPARRLYEIPLTHRTLADANDGWYAQPNATYPITGPGIALLDGQFAAGSKLTVNFVSGLKRWDGTAFVDPGDEQLAVSTTAAFTTSVLTKDAGPFNGIMTAAVTAAAGEHKTLRWRLLGDGVSPGATSDDGVYLVGLQLATDQPGVAASDPYYFLLRKDASAGDRAAALGAATALVPEPTGAAATTAVAAAAGLACRRRHA